MNIFEKKEKYNVPKLLELYASYNISDIKIRHTIDIIYSYYNYAYHQMLAFSETVNCFFDKIEPDHDTVRYFLDKSWSEAFSMYSLLRTALEALSTLRKIIDEKEPIDKYYKDNIIRIINLINDHVKHPAYKHKIKSSGSKPVSLDIGGEIDMVVWSEVCEQSIIKLDPQKDFNIIRDYIEYIAERL